MRRASEAIKRPHSQSPPPPRSPGPLLQSLPALPASRDLRRDLRADNKAENQVHRRYHPATHPIPHTTHNADSGPKRGFFSNWHKSLCEVFFNNETASLRQFLNFKCNQVHNYEILVLRYFLVNAIFESSSTFYRGIIDLGEMEKSSCMSYVLRGEMIHYIIKKFVGNKQKYMSFYTIIQKLCANHIFRSNAARGSKFSSARQVIKSMIPGLYSR